MLPNGSAHGAGEPFFRLTALPLVSILPAMKVNTDRSGRRATKGTEALWRAIRAKKWSQGQLARELGCHSGLVNKWLHGDQNPKAEWANEIERVTGVEAHLWGEMLDRPLRFPSTPPNRAA